MISERTKRLLERFDTADHKQRKGGKDRQGNDIMLTYVPTGKYIEKLIAEFDDRWAWEVTSHSLDIEKKVAIVVGNLTVEDADGKIRTKSGVGVAEDLTQGKRDEFDKLMKSANSEAIKNACKLLGIGLYLYDKDELKEVEREMRQPVQRPKAQSGNASAAAAQPRQPAVAALGPSANGGEITPHDAVVLAAQEAAPDAGDLSITTAINHLIKDWSGGQADELANLTDQQAQTLLSMIVKDGNLIRHNLPAHSKQVDPAKVSKCRSCQAPIVWMQTRSGKKMPVDAEGLTDADEVFSKAKHSSHWDTCPNAEQHRKEKEAVSA
jgi:hypothetical protein